MANKKNEVPRERYTFFLKPELVQKAKLLATAHEESLSDFIEKMLENNLPTSFIIKSIGKNIVIEQGEDV